MADWQYNFMMASSTAADVRGARKTSQSASIAFLVRFFEWFGDLGFFCFQLVRAVFLPPYEAREFAHQLDELGSKSLPLVALAGAATGVVLSLETHDSLVSFGAESEPLVRGQGFISFFIAPQQIYFQ